MDIPTFKNRIIAVVAALDDMVTATDITAEDKALLLPEIIKIIFRNDVIDV